MFPGRRKGFFRGKNRPSPKLIKGSLDFDDFLMIFDDFVSFFVDFDEF